MAKLIRKILTLPFYALAIACVHVCKFLNPEDDYVATTEKPLTPKDMKITKKCIAKRVVGLVSVNTLISLLFAGFYWMAKSPGLTYAPASTYWHGFWLTFVFIGPVLGVAAILCWLVDWGFSDCE